MADKKQTEKYQLVEIATQVTPVIQNPDGDNLSIEQVLLEILNDVKELKRHLI